MQLTTDTLTPADVKSLDQRFNDSPTEEILAGPGNASVSRRHRHQFSGRRSGYDSPGPREPFGLSSFHPGYRFALSGDGRAQKAAGGLFGIGIESLEPDLTVEEQADVNGPELWKHNPDLCCTLRKVLPLRDKLAELNCWNHWLAPPAIGHPGCNWRSRSVRVR